MGPQPREPQPMKPYSREPESMWSIPRKPKSMEPKLRGPWPLGPKPSKLQANDTPLFESLGIDIDCSIWLINKGIF